ncbi:MAG: hypothetical protein GY850_10970, partial [bacterium]|nr:hypothetical protein [bacterium]
MSMRVNRFLLNIRLMLFIGISGLFFGCPAEPPVVPLKDLLVSTNGPSRGAAAELEVVPWLSMGHGLETGPIGDEIRDVALGPTGSIWVATNRGLSKLVDGKFRHFTTKNGMRGNQIYSLAATGCGIVAGTRNGLVLIADPLLG